MLYWCFWIVMLEKTLESPLDCKEIKSVNPKGSQPLIFIGRTVTEPEAPMLWMHDVKSWLIGKDLVLGKFEGGRRRGRQRIRWLESITYSMFIKLSKLQDIVGDRGAWQATVHSVTKAGHDLDRFLSNSLWAHGILQARILEWVAVPFSRGSSQYRDRTQFSHIAGGFFPSWATREAHNKAHIKFHFYKLSITAFFLEKKSS